MDGRSVFIRKEMMIQNQHVELEYKLSTATWLTFAINHIFYCQKCMLISFSVKNHHLCFVREGFVTTVFANSEMM